MELADRIQHWKETHGTAPGNQAEDLSVSIATKCLYLEQAAQESGVTSPDGV